MALQFPTRAERPGKLPHTASLERGIWPEFMYHDAVLERLFDRVISEYAEFQFYAWDDEREEVVGAGNAIPDDLGRSCGHASRRRSRRRRRSPLRGRCSAAERALRAADPDRARVSRPGSQQPHDPANGRDRPRARARHADRSRPAQSQAQLPADPDRALHRVAPARRHAPRSLAPHARAARSRDREGRTRVDAHPGHGRPVGGVDGARIPRKRPVRRSRRARAGRDRPRAATRGSTSSRTSGWCTRRRVRRLRAA